MVVVHLIVVVVWLCETKSLIGAYDSQVVGSLAYIYIYIYPDYSQVPFQYCATSLLHQRFTGREW